MRHVTIIALATLSMNGCSQDKSGSARETQQSLQLAEEAAVTVGVPAIKNYAEKRQLKMIYELRDNANLVTYTYTMDMQGRRHKVCPKSSVGFGMPYSTQYTAPKALRMAKSIYPPSSGYNQSADWKSYEADQPEPNGLYMPQQANATWVICLHPDGKTLSPTYVEPRILVYLFEMPAVD
jgi:hypothetical protein